ncbi:MAG: ribonuclease P protein component [Proteobacteria bacterium]|nr:ribonuclease P protein component [Desulfocapsa sp.]MBU3944509.1 ribonuclease P protein component [Pseudomonadota bacterium]MBU3983555.1 ribonuclease P protein component [Pseudomonadota bacterium]MBU4028098.1 ribonuclease P protein component [Pseudomonadota bacterium]MBU4043148.1 ribonuclease P protein component [Pseudomonadota bacterium]
MPDCNQVFRLPKSHLLRKGWEFEQVYKQGRRLHGKGFTLIFNRNEFGYSRIGISVHRQIRGAVKRNRIKRIIRESFRLHRELFPESADIIFAIRPGMVLASTAEVNQAVAACSRAA